MENNQIVPNQPANPAGQAEWLDNAREFSDAQQGAADTVVQRNKNGKGLTIAARNGRFVSFLAGLTKVFFRVFRVDVYDKFQIGNKQRQNDAFVKFQNELKKNNPEVVLDSQKLTLGLLRQHIAKKPDNENLPDVMQGNKENGLEQNYQIVNVDAEALNRQETMNPVSELSNLEGLSQDTQKIVKDKLFDQWEANITGFMGEEEPNKEVVDKYMSGLILNSSKLGLKIRSQPAQAEDIINEYFGKSRDLSDKLVNFVTKDCQNKEADATEISQKTSDLMGAFMDFSNEYGATWPDGKAYQDKDTCFMFPVLCAANELKEEAIAPSDIFNEFLKTANTLAQAKSIPVNNTGESIIQKSIFKDSSFTFLVQLQPIRTCLEFSDIADGRAPDGLNTDMFTCLQLDSNRIVIEHGTRQNHIMKVARKSQTGLGTALFNSDATVIESFKDATGLVWDNLEENQKFRAAQIVDSLANAAVMANINVENYLRDMRPIIRKVTYEHEYAQKFKTSMVAASELMVGLLRYDSKIPSDQDDHTIHFRYERDLKKMYTDYIKASSILLELTDNVQDKPNLETMSLVATERAVIKQEQAAKAKHYAGGQNTGPEKWVKQCADFHNQDDSHLRQLNEVSRFVKYQIYADKLPSATVGLDSYSRQQILDCGPIRSLVRTANAHAYPDKPPVVLPSATMLETDILNRSKNTATVCQLLSRDFLVEVDTSLRTAQEKTVEPNAAPTNIQQPTVQINHAEVCTGLHNFLLVKLDIQKFTDPQITAFTNYYNLVLGREVQEKGGANYEEMFAENQLILKSLAVTPQLWDTIEETVKYLRENCNSLCNHAGDMASFKEMENCVNSINWIRECCKELAGQTGQFEIRPLMQAAISDIPADSLVNFANLIDNHEFFPLFFASNNARIFSCDDFSLLDFFTEYASNDFFQPLVEKAYLARDNDPNGIGLQVILDKEGLNAEKNLRRHADDLKLSYKFFDDHFVPGLIKTKTAIETEISKHKREAGIKTGLQPEV